MYSCQQYFNYIPAALCSLGLLRVLSRSLQTNVSFPTYCLLVAHYDMLVKWPFLPCCQWQQSRQTIFNCHCIAATIWVPISYCRFAISGSGAFGGRPHQCCVHRHHTRLECLESMDLSNNRLESIVVLRTDVMTLSLSQSVRADTSFYLSHDPQCTFKYCHHVK